MSINAGGIRHYKMLDVQRVISGCRCANHSPQLVKCRFIVDRAERLLMKTTYCLWKHTSVIRGSPGWQLGPYVRINDQTLRNGDFTILAQIRHVCKTLPPETFYGLRISPKCTPDLAGGAHIALPDP